MSATTEHPVSLLDEVRLQAQVLVPVLQALRLALGKDRAEALVGQALREHVRLVYQGMGEGKPADPLQKWRAIWAEIRPRIGGDVESEFMRDDDEAREYNVKRCRFAEFFNDLGEPGLGTILMCDFDGYIAEVGAPAVEYKRTQTLMQGAPCCDFRYRFKRG